MSDFTAYCCFIVYLISWLLKSQENARFYQTPHCASAAAENINADFFPPSLNYISIRLQCVCAVVCMQQQTQ